MSQENIEVHVTGHVADVVVNRGRLGVESVVVVLIEIGLVAAMVVAVDRQMVDHVPAPHRG